MEPRLVCVHSKLVPHDHPVLTTRADTVASGEDINALIADLLMEQMLHNALGVAAPQIGVSKRVCIVAEPGKPKIIMVNPLIWKTGTTTVSTEACLSLPDETHTVPRAAGILVSYTDQHGASKSLAATGLLATIIQHELDHLDGVLISDYPIAQGPDGTTPIPTDSP